MKRYFLGLFISLLLSNNLFSQEIEKNLKLVGIISRDTIISSGSRKLRLTVPNGRVWKVQNIYTASFDTNGNGAGSSITIEVNGIMIDYYPSSSFYSYNKTQIWLNSGDNIIISGDKYIVPPIFQCRFLAFEYILE
jgi:hypothetical protein